MRYRLRSKLALCAIALVLLVDLLVSAPLFFLIIMTRHETLIRTMLVISLSALVPGISGALIMSSLLLRPIRKLVRHVELIRDTEDKTKLANLEISISGRDEIAILGKTINEMTQTLARAAASFSELKIGKEIQKKFIPLDVDESGNKLNSGYKDAPNSVFFGYYQGARGLSGDYFDYLDLDGRYYAVIKCDVAGNGVPASLIMMQVATMFLNFFKKGDPSVRLEELVYQINGFIDTLGFKGRFAAFTLCLFDSETGELRFCNAGDNIIHIYDASEKQVTSITLPQTPAAGALPNSIVESKGGYRTQTLSLDHGDILLLYTDGIEDSKRNFRDASFSEITCPDGVAGQGSEAMGSGRVHEIINAVMNRAVYRMNRQHNPEGGRELCFDYSGCNGEVEEVIMALITAEKMFRCYRPPWVSADDTVLVEKKADVFLRAHFLQYSDYCSRIRECHENSSYIYYDYLMEDEQYDDLAILGIKRK
ncbi:MAG: SpoIIE family protein phosphatase [Treponema sp.]|jgi:serine phosphatase RsbU (regulator of sigma subunit)|nr:SpoIIE family protein phosphatase [Treponema sp.]